MFTGIIRRIGTVKSVTTENQSIFVDIVLPKGWRLKEGESISINGICSTVRKASKESFEVEYMPETVSKTTVLNWSAGVNVNLECSLKLNELMSGHLVSGHNDNKGEIAHIKT